MRIEKIKLIINNVLSSLFFANQFFLSILLITIFLLPNESFAHGGEDHSENNSTKSIESVSNSVKTKFFRSNNKEILLKYDDLDANKVNNFDLFITDTNNKGIILAKTDIILKDSSSENIFQAKKTNTVGWYQGHIKIKEGIYKTSINLNNELIDLGNLDVSNNIIEQEFIENSSIKKSIILLLIFLSIISLYMFTNSKGKINEV